MAGADPSLPWKPNISVSAFHSVTRGLHLKRPEGCLPPLKFVPEVTPLQLAALALRTDILSALAARLGPEAGANAATAALELWSQHVDPAADAERLELTFRALAVDLAALPAAQLPSTLELYMSTGDKQNIGTFMLCCAKWPSLHSLCLHAAAVRGIQPPVAVINSCISATWMHYLTCRIYRCSKCNPACCTDE